jgi:hypothetical protein
MNIHSHSARDLPNDELLTRVRHLASRERGVTAELVAHLAELEARRLHLVAGYGSMFAYCHGALSLTDHEAYNRIEAARAAQRFPIVLELLTAGTVSLTTVRLLAPHLTPGNHVQVLESARGLRRPQVEELVARLAPKADVPVSVRKLPAPAAETCAVSPAIAPAVAPPSTAPAAKAIASSPLTTTPPAQRPPASALAPTPRAAVSPLSPDRYKLQLTISGATLEKLRQAKDLLRHAHPSGDEAAIIDRALTLLLADVMKKKHGITDRPVPTKTTQVVLDGPSNETTAHQAPKWRRTRQKARAAVRRAVTVRDGAHCAFVGAGGRRCNERAFLEFHHVDPWIEGGGETVGNLQLRCRQHNVYEWELRSSEVRRLEDAWYERQHRARQRAPLVLKRAGSTERVGSPGAG